MKTYNTTGNVTEVWGSGPTAAIVRMGLRLACLEGLTGAEALIHRIREGDVSALAELTTIHLLRHGRFLGREARQLPTDAPGLIVIQMGRAPGGFKSWEPTIHQRFQPNIHTRVSALCLLEGGSVLTPEGEKLLVGTKLIGNPHAAFPLPGWIAETLTKAGEEYEHYTRPTKE